VFTLLPERSGDGAPLRGKAGRSDGSRTAVVGRVRRVADVGGHGSHPFAL